MAKPVALGEDYTHFAQVIRDEFEHNLCSGGFHWNKVGVLGQFDKAVTQSALTLASLYLARAREDTEDAELRRLIDQTIHEVLGDEDGDDERRVS